MTEHSVPFRRRLFDWGRAIWGWLPLTWRGALAIPLLVWLLRSYGIQRSDKMLFVIGAGGLGVVAVLMLVTLLLALLLRFRREPPAGETWQLHAGQPFRSGYRLSFLASLPLVNVMLEWNSPRGVSVSLVPVLGGLEEEATPKERGHALAVTRSYTVTDCWGLSRIWFRKSVSQELKIRPAVGQVRAVELPLQYASGDAIPHPEGKPEGDPIEMRPYTPGDPLKMVLWKVYARTGKMMVRLPERAISPVERTIAYLIAGPNDEASAGVACAFVDAGLFGNEFHLGADGTGGVARNGPEAVDQIIRSANARESGAEGLEDFLGQLEGPSSCILFVPPKPGPWLARLETVAARGQFHAILGVDGEPAPPEPGRWRRWVLKPSSTDIHRLDEVAKVCGKLSDMGIGFTVVERQSGQTVDVTA